MASTKRCTKQSSYENFLEQVINEKIGEFYPQRDENGTAIKEQWGNVFY